MTGVPTYLQMLANMSRHAPLDLDALIFPTTTKGANLSTSNQSRYAPSDKLWTRTQDDTSYIGIRVTEPIKVQQNLAACLAAAAVERQIIPIFLSWVGPCGMQRFGFRVEHIAGTTDDERTHCEMQIKRFWNLAITVDARDVAGMT